MKNLVIGNTSQLSYFFPNDYIKVSSRDLDYDFICSENWNKVFICFGESRKFINNIEIYDDINFNYTINIVDKVKNISNKVIVYSTCELWNQYEGQIDIKLNFNFYSTPYLQSKYKLSNYILSNNKYHNVIIIYPFNFNSIHRNNQFLFGKIFDSIINKTKIEIGDTYFCRDMIHPKFVVSESIKSEHHQIVGSGRMIYVNDFIRDLYANFDLEYNNYVTENISKYKEYDKRKEYYLRSNYCLYSYKQLLYDTIEDINKIKIK
jgi:nucleoside-diphosphate-sugar epimerase